MQSGAIADSQISSSSYSDTAKYGRLGAYTWWNPKWKKESEWLRVDLLSVVTMTAIQTQGSGREFNEYWAQLQIATGFSVDSMSYFKDNNQNVIVSMYNT